MTEKQKKMLVRIIVTFVIFAVLFAAEHTGNLESLEGSVLLFLFLNMMKKRQARMNMVANAEA